MNIHALPPWIDANAPNGFDLQRSILLTLGYTIDECHAVIKETGPFDEGWKGLKELRSEESDKILKTSMKNFKEHWEDYRKWREKDERDRYIHKRKWGKLYQPSKFRPTQLPLGKY
tara:strand:+ start:2087 stop:2434 length:348 start_codon:yes stop_codon:yes gene_type:complete